MENLSNLFVANAGPAASLEIARLDKSWFLGTRFIGNNLQEAKFNQVNLQGAVFDGNVMLYSVFPSSNMVDCQGCPKGWD